MEVRKFCLFLTLVDQFRGDSISGRGKGYGMLSLKVDGNDALAVFQAVKEAREYSVKNKEPVLLEFMTYRVKYILKTKKFPCFQGGRSFDF